VKDLAFLNPQRFIKSRPPLKGILLKYTTKIKAMAEKDNVVSSSSGLAASVSFMVLILVLGVPMWWKTTEVLNTLTYLSYFIIKVFFSHLSLN